MKKKTHFSVYGLMLMLGHLVACPWPGPNGYPPGVIEPFSVATNMAGGAGGLLVIDHYPPEREPRVSLTREFGEGYLAASLVSGGYVQPGTYYLKLEHDVSVCFVTLVQNINEGHCFRGDGQHTGDVRVAALPNVDRQDEETGLVETSSEKWIYGVPSHDLFNGSYEEVERRWREKYVFDPRHEE